MQKSRGVMASHSHEYEALSDFDSTSENASFLPTTATRKALWASSTIARRRVLFYLVICVQAIADLALLSLLWKSFLLSGPRNPIFPQSLYSPAQEVLQYKVVKFDEAFGKEITKYQAPPSDEVDALWEELYEFGISQIPRSKAELLPNKTLPIPGNEEYSIVTLDVFHQLHCLDWLRQSLYPDYYLSRILTGMNMTVEELDIHNRHCIDSIRQSLMCSSDISPIVWVWHEEAGQSSPNLGIVHTCRNFEAIHEWGKAHQLQGKYNERIRPGAHQKHGNRAL